MLDALPKPISPKAHGLNDHALAFGLFAAPTLFGLKGIARAWCYFFGATLGAVNLLTDHPVALKRVIPFRVHGRLEALLLPKLLLAPWLSGALRQAGAKRFFLPFFVLTLANFLFTDFNARQQTIPRRDVRGRFVSRNGRNAPKRRELSTARHG